MKSTSGLFLLFAGLSPLGAADDPLTVHRLAHLASAPHLTTITNDPRLRLTLRPPTVVMRGDGRQPFLFVSAQGTLFCQSQVNARPFRTKGKVVYQYRIGSALSRDGGATWTRWTHQENHDDVNIEGGAVQCADGSIIFLDMFVVPGATPDHGVGELWRSRDDLHTLEGPASPDFYLPHVKWDGSTDDTGKPEADAALHRSLIELPNGDLLTTLYTWFDGDTAPSGYLPSMMKTRVALIRSRDHGASWAYFSTVAMDSGVGTEGFGEPVLVRVARGPHTGRLLCLMRTGRELYATHSDNEGATWARPRPVVFPGVDIFAIDQWAGLFAQPAAPDYVPNDNLLGAMVDPDLIQMKSGVLVCGFGVRLPAKRYKENWRVPRNGNYLAFSFDGGDSWTHVVQYLSAAPTTQYMGVREVRPDVLYVVYDDSVWHMPGETMGFQLAVERTSSPGN